jgi:catechol 2,3-dioxygenase-like lactoylglutathione lyase family enzyme
MQPEDYTVPAQTRIGHVHLKVSNLEKSLDFYCGLLGFEITMRYGIARDFLQPVSKVLACFTLLFYIPHVEIWRLYTNA